MPGDSHSILIVDDDEDFRQFAQDCLSIAGDFDVKESTNGIDAALIVGSWHPSIVLLDLRMPKMNGFEFCRQMRSNGDFKDVKIIIMTGSYEEINAVHARRAGANDYAVKTAKYSSLIDIIQKTLCTQASE